MMIITYKGKKYEVNETQAFAGEDLTYYKAWVYTLDGEGDPIGYVIWPTKDEWPKHVWDSDKNACAVEDCSGWCEDESNACTWLDEDATFSLEISEADFYKQAGNGVIKEV